MKATHRKKTLLHHLAILGFYFSIWSWVSFFRGLWRVLLGFWWALHWICKLFLVQLPFLLSLSTKEHGRCFYFLLSSSISFFKALKLLSNRSFTCLVRVTPRYFMLFVAMVKGDVSLISISASLSFVYRRATDFLKLIVYPATLLRVFISCRRYSKKKVHQYT